ncbi:MAG: IS66 family transposase [Sulfuricaulis sp.]
MCRSPQRQTYDIESIFKDNRAEERYTARQVHSLPILKQPHTWMETTAPNVLPASLFERALHYIHTQWLKLARYTEDGPIPIDTNLVENAIRPFALRKRNWLFSATPKGATASARLFSLIETAKNNNIEPYRYLNDMITQLSRAKTIRDYGVLRLWRFAGIARCWKRRGRKRECAYILLRANT